jgi:hypothetical protein
MGLRTPSDWMTRNTQSQFKKPTTETGLTPKQQDMAGSMYPGAFKPSEPVPQDETVNATEMRQEKAQTQIQKPEKQEAKRKEMEQSGIGMAVAEASSKIGIFKYKLQEEVNNFLTQGPTETGLQSYVGTDGLVHTGTVNATEMRQEKAQTQIQKPEKQEAKRKEMEQSGIDMAVAEASPKIGIFKYKLQEEVNNFLTQGPTETGLQSYVGTDGLVHTGTSQDALNPAVAEKQGAQQGILNTMRPFLEQTGAGGFKAKQFKDVASGLFANPTADTSRLIQMVDTLDMLEDQGMSQTTEAQALRAQLEEMDTFGIASDLRNTKKTYEQLMGAGRQDPTKWYGETGKEGNTALELATLSSTNIQDELEKAMVSASGLFSGEVESSLKKTFDTQSAQAERASKWSQEANTQLSSALDTVLKEERGEFGTAKDNLYKVLDQVKGPLNEIMKKYPEATFWGDMMQDTGSFYEFITTALNDPESGIAAEDRAMLRKYLGDAAGEQGQFSMWLDELSSTGGFTVVQEDANGVPKETTLRPDGAMKNQITRLLSDPNVDKQWALGQVKEMMYNVKIDPSTTVRSFFGDLLSGVKDLSDTKATQQEFTTSLEKTMAGFLGTKTEDIFKRGMTELLKDSGIPGLDKMTTAALKLEFDKLPPNVKAELTTQIQKELQSVMGGQEIAYTKAMQAGTKDAKEAVGTKLKEAQSELSRLNTLKAKNTNLVNEAFGKLWTNLQTQRTAVNAATPKLRTEIDNSPWFQQMISYGLAKPEDAASIANAMSMEKLLPVLKQLNPAIGAGLPNLALYFDVANGVVDLKGIAKYYDAVEKVAGEILGNPGKYSETFADMYRQTAEGKQLLEQQVSRDKQISEAINTLAGTVTNLNAMNSTVDGFVSQLGKKLPIVMDAGQVVNTLLGAAQGDALTGENLAPTLEGMGVEQDKDGNFFLNFGGKYIPIDADTLNKIVEAKNANVKSAVAESDLLKGVTTQGLGASNLPGNMTIAKPLTQQEAGKAVLKEVYRKDPERFKREIKESLPGSEVTYDSTSSTYTVKTPAGLEIVMPSTETFIDKVSDSKGFGSDLVTQLGGSPDPSKMYTQKDIQDLTASGAQPGGGSNFLRTDFMRNQILALKDTVEKAVPGLDGKAKVNIDKSGNVIIIPQSPDGVIDEVNGIRMTVDPRTNKVTRIDYNGQAVEPTIDPKTGDTVFKPVRGVTPVEVAADEDYNVAAGKVAPSVEGKPMTEKRVKETKNENTRENRYAKDV